MAHRTNLAMQTLSNLSLVAKVETLCERLYNYFRVSPKRHLEFTKLVDVVETGGLKLLRNVKTQWISVLEPLKRIMLEYKTLIVKMAEDTVVKNPNVKEKEVSAKARNNLDLLCDVGTLLALLCLTPLLESVESLIKFAQSPNVFVSDYVAAVKIYQAEIYMMYIDPDTSFMASHFQMFCDIIEDCSYAIQLEWVVDLSNGSESLAYRILGHTYVAHSLNPISGEKDIVSRANFARIVAGVKGQCTSVAEILVAELSKRILDFDLMNALDIVFPQFWLQPNIDELFPLHLKTLKSHFCEIKSVNKGTEKEPSQ